MGEGADQLDESGFYPEIDDEQTRCAWCAEGFKATEDGLHFSLSGRFLGTCKEATDE